MARCSGADLLHAGTYRWSAADALTDVHDPIGASIERRQRGYQRGVRVAVWLLGIPLALAMFWGIAQSIAADIVMLVDAFGPEGLLIWLAWPVLMVLVVLFSR